MIHQVLALTAATIATRAAVIPTSSEHANVPLRGAVAATVRDRSAARSDSLRDAASSLLPVPRSVRWDVGQLRLNATSRIAITGASNDRLRRGIQRFRSRLERRLGVALPRVTDKHSDSATITIDVAKVTSHVQSVDEDESYSLIVSPNHATIRAATVVGGLRGLETLLQLVTREGTGGVVPAATIDDSPRFRWRGLLVDVSRHFIPVAGMKRTLDGMAAVKLNVLHWHLSDDQGFRVQSRRFPKLTSLGSDGRFYTAAEVRQIVAYAADRGIRVIPEFDMPGHSTSWFVGYPQYASIRGRYRIVRTFGAGDAAFDPTRDEVFSFIDRFVGEMAPIFPDAYWHVGGDEVDNRLWDRSSRVRAYRRSRKIDSNAELQARFSSRLSRILARHGKRMIGWDEILQATLPQETVVQSWRGSEYLEQSTRAGHPSLLSAPWYLDRLTSSEDLYAADPIPAWTELTAEQQSLVIGGEACMWTEHADAATIDSRIWPRLGAVAERLWSPREVNNTADMYRRLDLLETELDEIGLGASAHTGPLLRRITPQDDARQALSTILEAIAPPTFGQRIRLQRTTQLTPLTGIIDAAIPDPPGRWATTSLVRTMLAEPVVGSSTGDGNGTATPRAARDSLVMLYTRWRTAAAAVRDQAAFAPSLVDAIPAADALARVSAIALEAMSYIDSPTRPPQGWAEPLLVELTRLEEPQNILRVLVIQPVRRLVNAAAVNSH